MTTKPKKLFQTPAETIRQFHVSKAQLGRLYPFLVHIVIRQRRATYLISVQAAETYVAYTEATSQPIGTRSAQAFVTNFLGKQVSREVPKQLTRFLESKTSFLPDEVAIVLGVSRQTITNWIEADLFGPVEKLLKKTGKGRRFSYDLPQAALQSALICTVPA